MQKELNFTVGQKVWSIQLGECEVISIIDERIRCKPVHKSEVKWMEYEIDGKLNSFEYSPSLFESNPFEPKMVQEKVQENKAELINAMCAIINAPVKAELKDIAKDELQKLLESL